MRLIDADELMEHVWRDKLDSREAIAKMINDAQTVKDIPTKIPIDIFGQLISKAKNCVSYEDAISRKEAISIASIATLSVNQVVTALNKLPPVTPQETVTEFAGRCKECKHFEYDSVAKVDGVPLIVAHEICKRWGDGCKTNEDGYCFLFEPKEEQE